MKWILLTMLIVSTQAGATVIQYTFDVETLDFSSGPDFDVDRADMTLLVDANSRQITSLIYQTKFFDINFQGAADITRSLWWLNDDGTGYYGIYSLIEGAMPDGGNIDMYLETAMPLDGNPAYFLNQGMDDQGFNFGLDTEARYGGFWRGGKRVIVPESATLSLLALGLAAIGLRRRRR